MVRFICKTLVTGLLLSLLSSWVRADPLPSITAQAWLIADETGKIIEGTHTTDVRSIASITKLMTVMVVLDTKISLTEKLPKKLYNKVVTRQDLIDLAIIKSDNTAAKMLCDTYPSGYLDCITAMNKKAESLGMYKTSFVDPTGLYNDNVSTAEDLIKLVKAASYYPAITNASNTDKITWNTGKKKYIQFNNTNTLVGKGVDFIVSKTGWIRASGGCIVMMLETVHGIRTVILLGSKNTKTRIPEAHLISKLL
jgi:serine-type D-Ala-D-Ala endopeptidase (penicillin-binding protein 7)